MKCFHRNRCSVTHIIHFEGYLSWGRHPVSEKDLEIAVHALMRFKISLQHVFFNLMSLLTVYHVRDPILGTQDMKIHTEAASSLKAEGKLGVVWRPWGCTEGVDWRQIRVESTEIVVKSDVLANENSEIAPWFPIEAKVMPIHEISNVRGRAVQPAPRYPREGKELPAREGTWSEMTVFQVHLQSPSGVFPKWKRWNLPQTLLNISAGQSKGTGQWENLFRGEDSSLWLTCSRGQSTARAEASEPIPAMKGATHSRHTEQSWGLGSSQALASAAFQGRKSCHLSSLSIKSGSTLTAGKVYNFPYHTWTLKQIKWGETSWDEWMLEKMKMFNFYLRPWGFIA